MAHVALIEAARIHVVKSGQGYIVEAAIPWKALMMSAPVGETIAGDFGVTFSGRNGQDTVRRVYWSNKATGIVNDEVAELRMDPEKWGLIRFVK